MSGKAGRTTRRRFLELGAAGAAFVSLGGRSSAEPREVTGSAERRDHHKLFSEGRIASLVLKNRLVRAATAEGATPDGEITDALIELYKNLADGGVGLIITGHMAVTAGGRASELQTCIYDDGHVRGIAKIADVVHKAGDGCKIVAQINHAGRQSVDEPVVPSEIASRATRRLRVISTEEIGELAAQYAEAARRVKEAGFDGVEIHAAHGYLLSSFLSPRTNRRTDKYGGSVQNRATVVKETIGLVRDKVGDDFPILVKANCVYRGSRGTDADSFSKTAKEIEKAGVDAIEISGANPVKMRIDSPEKESYFMEYAEKLDLNIPVILTGGNRSVEPLEQAFQQGKVDFFGFARPLIREPDLPNRWLEAKGGDTAKCISCNGCLRQLAKGPIYCVVEAASAAGIADS